MYLNYETDRYELCNILSQDEILSDIPFDLMRENIYSQIQNPMTYNMDYMESVIQKFEVTKEMFSDHPDIIQGLNIQSDTFMNYIITYIENEYGIDIDLDNIDDVSTTTNALYQYFVLNFKENMTNFIYNYIMKNKDSYIKEYESTYKNKDVTIISLKKSFKSKDQIILISNLPSIIKDIKTLNIEPIEFINLSIDYDNYYTDYMRMLITTNSMNGDFVTNYLNKIYNGLNGIIDEIESSIRYKLTHVYK